MENFIKNDDGDFCDCDIEDDIIVIISNNSVPGRVQYSTMYT